jgi:hypothetical protein
MFPCGNERSVQRKGLKILLGNKTGGGADMLQPIKFQCAGIKFSTRLSCIYTCVAYMHIYIYSRTGTYAVSYTYTQFQLTQNYTYVLPSRYYLLHVSGSACVLNLTTVKISATFINDTKMMF